MLEHLKGDIPTDVMQLILKYLQSLNLEKAQDKEIVLTLWDFAGQHLYYASQGIFLMEKAIYLMIYDLSKDLGEACEEGSNQTIIENMLSWLVCVHNICESGDCGKGGYLLPPIMIVGTHADSPHQKPEKIKQSITEHLEVKQDVHEHVVGHFEIENSDCEGAVKQIQDKILEILREEFGQKIPVKWFHFEKVGCLSGSEKHGAHLQVVWTIK